MKSNNLKSNLKNYRILTHASVYLLFFFDSIGLTKLDILDVFDELKIGVGYLKNGNRMDSFPGLYWSYL